MPLTRFARTIALIMTVSACMPEQPTQETVTHVQALERVERLIRQTAAALTPPAELELIPYSTPPNPCAWSEDGIPERFSINRKYWLRGLPGGGIVAAARQVHDHWEAQGHAITSTGGFETGHPSITGTSNPDGFVLALAWAEGDNLYLAATSPCLPPQDAPHP